MKHNTFYKNTLLQYGLQILKYLFPLLLIPYLTRILGTEGYAVFAYVLSFMGVVQTIADFGFTLSGTKKVVDLRGDTAALSRLVGAITVARLMLLCGLFFCVMVVTRFIPIMDENRQRNQRQLSCEPEVSVLDHMGVKAVSNRRVERLHGIHSRERKRPKGDVRLACDR